ncbi:amtB [Symbiodinium necroappetens]|uniref:AmtB protein n=1 Tax=Symbiodinium necroappetens TaxID=1628268 RepID=A0A813C8P0_9DINO|nr:amtB [Symbiodinium necroappetens]
MVAELQAVFPQDGGRRLLVPPGPSRPSSRASTASRGTPRGKTLKAVLALPSAAPKAPAKETVAGVAAVSAVVPREREAPPTPRLGSEASDELAASISVLDVAGTEDVSREALVSVMHPPSSIADQGRQAVSDLFAWMRPLRSGNYAAKGLTRLAFEIEERSQEWSAYLGGRCTRKESLDVAAGEAVPPKDFSSTAEAASLMLRVVRALPRGFALRTMLEPLLQELMEAIFCEWPRTLPSLQDLREDELWPERLGQLSTYAQLVSGYRAGLEESKAAQKILEEREQEASALAKSKSKAFEDLRVRIRRLEDERDKAKAEMQLAKRGCQEAEEMYETFKQQTKLALIDYSDMQYREATIKADLSSLNILCREKDIAIQDLRNQVTLLTQETQNLEEKLLKAREELERQAAAVEQLPVLTDKLQYYEHQEGLLGVAFAERVSEEVLGRSLEEIVGKLPSSLTKERKTSIKLEAVMEALRGAHRDAEKLKEQVVKLRYLLEDVKQLVPIWNESAMQDVADAYDEDAAIHRQVYSMSDKRSFAGLGVDDSVPPYLRAEGLVRHRYISKKECEDLIESFLAEAPADLSTQTMHTELYQHMQRQFTDPEELTEFAYAFICSLEAYRDDPDFEMFDLMLAGAVHPSIMQDQETMLKELQNLVHNCADGNFEGAGHGRQRSTLTGTKASGRDQVSRRMMRAVMQAMFPEKSVERMNALMRALHVTLQMLFDAGRSASPDTAYVSDLFSATADGTQSPLIEEMRRQHLHEVLEFTAEISQNLIRAAGGETRVNLSGRLDTFMLITREATSQTLQEIGLPDTRTLSMALVPLAAGQNNALVAELEALRAEVLAQRVLIEEQQQRYDSMVEDRRLQVGYVSTADFNTQVQELKNTQYSLGGAMDSAWLCLCGALVMFMHAGFAMLETGSCRAKNASNVLMKNLVNVTVGTLGWWAFGWAFAYGNQGDPSNGFIGTSEFFGVGLYTKVADTDVITPLASCDADGCQSKMLSWFFQWAFCTAGATIVSGGVAERVKSPTYAVYAFCMTSFIYPVVVAWTWGYGWLDSVLDVGYMDFAGSAIVHLTGGVSALAGTVVLGPRKGRFENPDEFECHNLPLVVLGTFALWFGWYGFNPGSTLGMHTGDTGAMAAQVAMNTTLSAATGGITVFLLRYAIMKKYDVGGLCNGILAGLVSITAGCGNVECGSAVAIGLLGGLVYQGSSMLLQKLKIDDPVDASPVHGFCGIWGALAAGLFDWGKGFDHYHGWSGFGCKPVSDTDSTCMTGIGGTAIAAQLIMILVIILWAGTLSGLAFFALKMTGLLRIDEYTEEVGMDVKQHSPPKAYAIGTGSPASPAGEVEKTV